MAYAADRCGGCHVCGVAVSGAEWGPEIPVNGVRPVWLADDVSVTFRNTSTYSDKWSEPRCAKAIAFGDKNFVHVTRIRLSASHFAYTAIAKGFEPYVGSAEPDDWDNGAVLTNETSKGCVYGGGNLDWASSDAYPKIIGYRKRKQPEEVFIPKGKIEPSHVSVKRMTQANADELFGAYSYSWQWAKDNGLIRPETHAERIATKTGLTVAQVEAVLAADKEVG